LACAWLDNLDLHRIRAVSLYLARHGVLVSWSVPELAVALLDEDHHGRIAEARDEFRDIAREVIRSEGGKFPIA
jgi:hypothetical protein